MAGKCDTPRGDESLGSFPSELVGLRGRDVDEAQRDRDSEPPSQGAVPTRGLMGALTFPTRRTWYVCPIWISQMLSV